jgi:hypothetical protein
MNNKEFNVFLVGSLWLFMTLLVGSRLYKGDYKFTEMLLYIVATMVWVHSVEDT